MHGEGNENSAEMRLKGMEKKISEFELTITDRDKEVKDEWTKISGKIKSVNEEIKGLSNQQQVFNKKIDEFIVGEFRTFKNNEFHGLCDEVNKCVNKIEETNKIIMSSYYGITQNAHNIKLADYKATQNNRLFFDLKNDMNGGFKTLDKRMWQLFFGLVIPLVSAVIVIGLNSFLG